MIRIVRNIYLRNRTFLLLAGIIILFILSYPFPFLFPTAQLALIIGLSLIVTDLLLLFAGGTYIKVKRRVISPLSLGDEHDVTLTLTSRLRIPVKVTVIDEAPYQLQLRNMSLKTSVAPGEKVNLVYNIRPTQRGIYEFGQVHCFIHSILGLTERRLSSDLTFKAAVYPSVLQMKKYELKVFNKLTLSEGIKRVRRLGTSSEFEQIKNYVQGDDYRRINWKATSRKSELMVNQYEDEKAQQIYCIIDKSRAMRMPFNGMTLLDYAINTSLVITNIALKKFDRAGLITFSDKIGNRLSAERSPGQLKKILEILYRQKTRFNEANFELLYYTIRQQIKGRSLILLYTNFESHYALQRVLPLLRKINQKHLLVVIFFENKELADLKNRKVETIKDIYFNTVARKLAAEKQQIIQELKKHAIQTILTTPENLSVDTINKYLELKSRGMI